jgi:hypothetical protein
MTSRLGRLTIAVSLMLAIALTLAAFNLPTGIGEEEVLQRTTEETEHEHTTTTRSTSSSGTCPAGVVCSSISSSNESSTSESSSGTLTFRTVPSSTTSLTFRTLTSSSTRGPEPACTYWGFIPGTVKNTTITITGTRTNQTNSTVVTTCVIPGFPLEGTIVGAAVGLLFVIISRRKARRVRTN